MKTLVIDNYDSFTYNLVHILADISDEIPMVVKNDEVTWEELRKHHFDSIVISPGPGRPDRQTDFGVSRDAILFAEVPLLGVCLGHQGIAALAGGTIVRAPTPYHGRTSVIHHTGTDPLFYGMPAPFEAARYHSLLAARPLPPALVETAWTQDGLIMGLAHRERPQWGVQFHPESIITDSGRRLLENFKELTRENMRSRRRGSRVCSNACCNSTGERKGRRTFWRQLPAHVDAEAAFVALFADCPTAFWLDSSLVEPGRSRWSYLGDASGPNAAVVQYRCKDKSLTVSDRNGSRTETMNIFDYLEHTLTGPPSPPPPCPFVGGYVGWFGYELRNECGSPTGRTATTPDAFFIRADRFIAIDHENNVSYLVSIDVPAEAERAEQWISETFDRISDLDPLPQPSCPKAASEPLEFILDHDRQTYLSDIKQCLAWIGEGETYQVCLTNEVRCQSSLDPLSLYRTMRRINPAPYAAFLKWPGGAVLSASPERFLTVDPEGVVETKPIKGTIGRLKDSARDNELAEQLRRSKKDRAENVMIVDLLRNDLSRVCEPGSVVVPKLCAVESYATVHQLVSTIRGVLRPGLSVVDLIRASFPGGSMTGAPKIRTMALIDALEQRPRGIYSGALGWVGENGATDLSIVIRTIVAENNQLSMGVGGGIVALSTPEDEFAEMLLKAKASLMSIIAASGGAFEEPLLHTFVEPQRIKAAS